MGVFQLFFLSNVPEHAAVHATIQSARSLLHERTGFANAVLRTVQRKCNLETSFSSEVARKRLSIGKRSWLFDKAIFSDPERFPVDFWAEQLSFPSALVARWFEACGPEKAITRMKALNEIPPLWLRVNSRRANRGELVEAFTSEGIDVFEHPDDLILRIQKPGRDPSTLPGFAEGLWSVQDPTSFQCLKLSRPKPGQRVLDLCAAPGGKSFAVAELTGGEAEVVACDISETRLARLKPEAERLGHDIQTHLLNPDGSGLPSGPFDLIILDVPCSNTGVLNKRLEARSTFHKDQMHRSTTTQNLIRKRVQKELLGRTSTNEIASVLWTTCSIEPEENAEMAKRIEKQTELSLIEELCIEPDGFQAGGYAAMLKFKQ
jgi:16S rRNA (cytosine967-C5)-methyltransferase